MKFKLRQMEVFRAVMITGSINGAARLLFTSQPAISRIVAHTETTLGLKLFDRHKGKLVPTPEAKALFVEVDTFYQTALQVEEFAQGLVDGASGTLNIACSPCLCRGVMTRAISKFTRSYPKVRLNLRATLLNNMPQDILSRKVDMAISVLPLDHPNLKVEPILIGHMICIAPGDHPLAQQEKVSIKEVARHQYIGHHLSLPFSQLVAAAFRKAGETFAPQVHIHQTDVALSLVRAGVGVAVIDGFTPDGLDMSGIAVLPLVESIQLTPSIVYSHLVSDRGHADKMTEILRQQSKHPLGASA